MSTPPISSFNEPGLGRIDRSVDDFSVVLGGPLYQLLTRWGLIQPPCGKVGRRAFAIVALSWLPLAVLTRISARFVGGVKVPFAFDFEVQTRLLFALPLMILAEWVVYVRMRDVAQQFLERQIIPQNMIPAFKKAVASATRLRNSIFIEIGMLLLVFLGGRMIWREAALHQTESWLASLAPAGPKWTLAGYYYLFVSLPLFQFILLRWYFRIFIWSRFLFQVARLELNLIPVHPDRCCGLGFLGTVVMAFSPLLIAHSGLAAAYAANRIVHDGATLPDFKFELAGLAVFLVAIVLGPLCVFMPKLNSARFAGLRIYGPLASEYVISFTRKWTGGGEGVREPLLGTSDIQSLADLDNSYGIVQEVKLVPFGKQTILRLVIFIALPLLPLLFTMFSLEELVKRLLSIVL